MGSAEAIPGKGVAQGDPLGVRAGNRQHGTAASHAVCVWVKSFTGDRRPQASPCPAALWDLASGGGCGVGGSRPCLAWRESMGPRLASLRLVLLEAGTQMSVSLSERASLPEVLSQEVKSQSPFLLKLRCIEI